MLSLQQRNSFTSCNKITRYKCGRSAQDDMEVNHEFSPQYFPPIQAQFLFLFPLPSPFVTPCTLSSSPYLPPDRHKQLSSSQANPSHQSPAQRYLHSNSHESNPTYTYSQELQKQQRRKIRRGYSEGAVRTSRTGCGMTRWC